MRPAQAESWLFQSHADRDDGQVSYGAAGFNEMTMSYGRYISPRATYDDANEVLELDDDGRFEAT